MPVQQNDEPKQYEAPVLRRITSEQAKLICIPYAWIGHKAARELLEILFGERQRPDTSNHYGPPTRNSNERHQGC
jgi:hypothetical protein